jgi:hypothetical protein
LYSQHFVLGKEKREGDTVTCQGKKFINPHYCCGIQRVYVLHLSAIQRAQACVNDEHLRQSHFICHDFRCKPNPSFLLNGWPDIDFNPLQLVSLLLSTNAVVLLFVTIALSKSADNNKAAPVWYVYPALLALSTVRLFV